MAFRGTMSTSFVFAHSYAYQRSRPPKTAQRRSTCTGPVRSAGAPRRA